MKRTISLLLRMLSICGMALPLLLVPAPRLVRAQGQQAPRAATDKAQYWSHADLVDIWKDLEAKQVINKRVMEGGTYSLNIRTIKEDSPPLVHAKSIDLWIIEAGNPISVTGGHLVGMKTNPNSDDMSGTSISGGVEQPMKPGDIVFIPTGVPHGFKNTKGFRALLIRWEIKAPGVGAKSD